MGVVRRSDARRQVRPAVRRRDERGAAAVEFALVLPILLLLVFGIISYGYMLSFRGSMSQAAAEGARAAAVSSNQSTGASLTAAQSAVNGAISTYGVTCAGTPGAGASVNLDLQRGDEKVGSCRIERAACATGAAPECITVALTYNYRGNELIPVPIADELMPESIGYTASARVS